MRTVTFSFGLIALIVIMFCGQVVFAEEVNEPESLPDKPRAVNHTAGQGADAVQDKSGDVVPPSDAKAPQEDETIDEENPRDLQPAVETGQNNDLGGVGDAKVPHQTMSNASKAKKDQEKDKGPSVIQKGNIKYFLDKQQRVTHAEVYDGDRLTKIQQFYEDTTVDNAPHSIKYLFMLDASGFITKAAYLDKRTQQPVRYYEYYQHTVFGQHAANIKYIFHMNKNDYLTKAVKREQGTKRTTNVYNYYSKTKYGNHGDRILYRFDLNKSGSITKAIKRERGTRLTTNVYNYYNKTKYGDHGDRILYRFNLNNSGYITKAIKREQGTRLTTNVYNYYNKTKYGNHGDQILYRFDLDKSGYITKAIKREQGTGLTTNVYNYYSKTKYGSHGDQILYRFDLNNSGYITKAIKRERGTRLTTNVYNYYSKTKYGNHGDRILYRFDLDNSGYIVSAVEKEIGSQRHVSTFFYKPKTVYGKHGSRITGKVLNVPVISQLPELPTGCEITSVAMMLQYKGKAPSHIKLAKEMPRHSWNPRSGYVGNPFTKRGWTIYPSALKGIITKYAGNVVDLTGKGNAALKAKLSANKPVTVWVSKMHGFTVHAITLTGYDQNTYYYNDPWTGEKNAKMKKPAFNKLWKNQKMRAVTY